MPQIVTVLKSLCSSVLHIHCDLLGAWGSIYLQTSPVLCLVSQLCLTLWDPRNCSPSGSSIHGDSPGKNTGVGSLSLLQGIFPTQGSNPGLQHCRRILYQLSHKGSPRILEWVAYPFSIGSSWLGNLTSISCIAGWFFTNWAIREAPHTVHGITKSQRWLRN